MALSFSNGVITDTDRDQTYDLNTYGQSAAKGGDTAGNVGALHSFYDAWNLKNQPKGSVQNPTGGSLGTTQYNIGLMDRNMTNNLSDQGSKLLPQISEWYKGIRASQPNALTGGGSAPQAQNAQPQVWNDQKIDTSQMMKAQVMPGSYTAAQIGATGMATPTAGRQQTFNALTGGQSQPAAPPMQVATDTGNAGVMFNDAGFSRLNDGQPLRMPNQPAGSGSAPAAPAAPATGVGAGRGYPSNWNANNAPGLASGGEGTTFATNPSTGASYETSPMYQWQLKQGEKSINRALAARGRKNSSVGLNTLANFYNQLGAGEADKQYNRTFDQQKLGMQAALAQAQAAGASAGQLAQLAASLGSQMSQGSTGYGQSIADLIKSYGQQESGNQLQLGAQQGAAAMWKGTPIGNLLEKSGGENAQFWTSLFQMGGEAVNAYMKSRGTGSTAPNPTLPISPG